VIVTDEMLAETRKLERGMQRLRIALDDLSCEVRDAVRVARSAAQAVEGRAAARRRDLAAIKLRLDRIERRLDLVD
jgi:hypothetical protein